MNPSQDLAALVSESWEALLARAPYFAAKTGRKVERLTPGTLAAAEAAAADAQARLARLDAIDLTGLTRTERLTAAHLRHSLEDETGEPLRWWTSFGTAPITFSGVALILPMIFPAIDLTIPEERTRYLQLVEDFAASVDAVREQSLAQAERGWRLPRPALPGARGGIEGIASSSAQQLMPDPSRGGGEAFAAQVAALLADRVTPAFDALLAVIGPDYEALAPVEVGMCHQPGGVEAYRQWVRFHLSYDETPEELHRIGLEQVKGLADAMARLRVEAFGHNGDEASFHERLRADPRAKVPSPEALEATFHCHLDRMAPVFARIFRKGPQSVPIVKRLAPELEAGMTFGYYDPPQRAGAEGIYHSSGNGIPDRLQMNAAPLIFHELVPGHHVHITRQAENAALPEYRRETFAFSAFNEGWAEYSAGLAEEEGLYDDPYDHYGWLAHQRFIAQRLVVDTGMNLYGWTLAQARDYMAANTLEGPTQVASETLRYSTDMPAQALAYRMGFLKFRALREAARARLGDRFDIADFHEAILEEGGLPIAVLEQSIAEWAEGQLDADR